MCVLCLCKNSGWIPSVEANKLSTKSLCLPSLNIAIDKSSTNPKYIPLTKMEPCFLLLQHLLQT